MRTPRDIPAGRPGADERTAPGRDPSPGSLDAALAMTTLMLREDLDRIRERRDYCSSCDRRRERKNEFASAGAGGRRESDRAPGRT